MEVGQELRARLSAEEERAAAELREAKPNSVVEEEKGTTFSHLAVAQKTGTKMEPW